MKSISSVFQISRNTVRKYVQIYQENSLSVNPSMLEENLQEMFSPSPRRMELENLLPDYEQCLGVTVKSLYEEYVCNPPEGYRHA